MNDRIMIHSKQNKVRFTEKITVANEINEAWWYGDGSHHNNNYDYGVQLNNAPAWGGDKAGALDEIFQKEYLANQEKIFLPQEITDLATGLPTHSDAVTLPSSTDEGPKFSDYRPTLVFNSDGTADYLYHYNNSYQTEHYGSIEKVIFHSQHNINVYGIVSGNSTVVTSTGKSIAIVDDLVYVDYIPHLSIDENWGVPFESQNVLGLVTGKHISFLHKWRKEIKGDYYKVRGNIINPVNDPSSDEIGELHINASMLALGDEATEWWDRSREYYFDLYLTGNHILDLWYPPSAGSSQQGAHNITFNHDLRLLSIIQPHGFPNLQTQDGLLLLALSNWQEQNNFISP